MLCGCSREQFKFDESEAMAPEEMPAQEHVSGSGLSTKTIEAEAKLDEGNIEEAESSLREAMSLNDEVARALLGKLEFQKGNVEAALKVFDGIDISSTVPRLRVSAAEKSRHRRGKRPEAVQPQSVHHASLLLEATHLKAKSLERLGRIPEAAQECKSVLDTVEAALPEGIPDAWGEGKIQETVAKSVELLPELYKQAGLYTEAIGAYRRALLSPWNLDAECSGRLYKSFAVLLLYGGVEAVAPSLAFQNEGAFTPKNNMEEAILLLLILQRKQASGKISWDPTVMEHLSFALSMCGQSGVLAQQFEELLPGVLSRSERWSNLGLCYAGAGEDKLAINLLRKCAHRREKQVDVYSLLLGAKLCAGTPKLAQEAVQYAQRALENISDDLGYLRGTAFHVLGVALASEARLAFSDSERTRLQSESLKALGEANSLRKSDSRVTFDLALAYAEQHFLNAAFECAQKYLEFSCKASVKGWRLLALILSAQKRYEDAVLALDAAIDETGRWEQGNLLRTKAKVQVADRQPMKAIETYRSLLALVQAQRKSFEAGNWRMKEGTETVEEVEVWQDLAAIYTSLEQWRDAEICLEKAQGMKTYSAATWQGKGALHEARGELQDARASYSNALAIDPEYVPSKIAMGSLIGKAGGSALAVARSFLTDALRLEPSNHLAWYRLGVVHKEAGHLSAATECLEASVLLEQLAPVENFSSIPRALFW